MTIKVCPAGYSRQDEPDGRVTVAIQAGGESRRMGRSKATVPFGGRPLICRLVERVAPVADEILITTNEPENLAFLEETEHACGIVLCRDAFERRGSLAGLYTALSASSHEFVCVCACDMHSVSARVFAAELAVAREGGHDVVVPVNAKGFEPFHAVYRKGPCLDSAVRALAQGKMSMKSVVLDPALDVRHFSMEEVLAAEPQGGCFSNCNTPEELARAEELVFGTV